MQAQGNALGRDNNHLPAALKRAAVRAVLAQPVPLQGTNVEAEIPRAALAGSLAGLIYCCAFGAHVP